MYIHILHIYMYIYTCVGTCTLGVGKAYAAIGCFPRQAQYTLTSLQRNCDTRAAVYTFQAWKSIGATRTCVYIYIYECIQWFMYTYTSMYSMYMHVCTYLCIYVFLFCASIFVHVYMYTYICIILHKCMYVQSHGSFHTFPQTTSDPAYLGPKRPQKSKHCQEITMSSSQSAELRAFACF